MKNTFIISAYKRNDLVEKCLSSLRKFHPESEVIICDDGSTKEVQEDLKVIAKKYKAELLLSYWNGGFGHNNNKAIYRAKGDIITLVNDDLEFTQNIETELFHTMKADPKIGIMGYLLFYPDGRIQHGGHVQHKNSTLMEHYDHGKRKEAAIESLNRWYIKGVTGALMSLRKSMIEEIGAFKNGYGLAFEDVEICLRAWHTGWRVWYTSGTTAIHHEGMTRGNSLETKIKAGTIKQEESSLAQYLIDVKSYDFNKMDSEIKSLNSKINGTFSGAVNFIRMGGLGDCIMTTGVIREYKRQNPMSYIVATTRHKEVYANIPEINEIMINPYSKADITINLDLCYEKLPGVHRVDAYAGRALGWNKFNHSDVLPNIPESKVRVLMPFEINKDFVVIHPSASWPSRTISLKVWDKIIDGLIERGYQIVCLRKGADIVPTPRKGLYDLSESFEFDAIRDIISQAKCFIGPDSGLLHIAQLTKTRTIGVFSVVDPSVTLWRKENTHVVRPNTTCRYCLTYKISPPVTNLTCEYGTNECIKSITAKNILGVFDGNK